MKRPGSRPRVVTSASSARSADPQSGLMRREGGFQVGSATQLRMDQPVRFVGRVVRLWWVGWGSVRALIIAGRKRVRARRGVERW